MTELREGVGDLDPRLGTDPERHFAGKAFDPEHARRVLAGPFMEEILRHAGMGAGGNLLITEADVSADLAMIWVVEPTVLGSAMARVGRIAEAPLAQRAVVSAPWKGGLQVCWSAAAATTAPSSRALTLRAVTSTSATSAAEPLAAMPRAVTSTRAHGLRASRPYSGSR